MSMQESMKEIFLDERTQALAEAEKRKNKPAPDRKRASFYIEKSLIKEQDAPWYALPGDGIRIERVDIREAIDRWGWTVRTNLAPSTTGRPKKSTLEFQNTIQSAARTNIGAGYINLRRW